MKACREVLVCFVAFLFGLCTAGSQPLKITTIVQEPYAMTQDNQLEGYCMDLLAELSKKVGFKYSTHVVKDGRYGMVDDSGNWIGMIGEVIRGEADLAVAPLTLTANREKVVDMSKPFMQTGLSFILRKDAVSDEPGFLSLLSPFSSEMWVGVLVSYLLTTVCMYLVARISPCEWEGPQAGENHFNLQHSFWYAAGALTLQGAGPHPKALSGRVVSAIWWLFSLALLACYFARLNAWLQSDVDHLTIQTFEDLSKQDVIQYGTLKGSSSLAFFKTSNNPIYSRMYAQMEKHKSYVANMEEGIRRAQEGNYAFIGESVSLDLTVGRNCDLMRSSESIGMRGYSIAAPLGFPMMKNLSVAILQLSESGELDFLRRKWWPNSCVATDGKGSPLTPSTLKGIFLLLALGLGLGLMLALLELSSKSRSQAKNDEKSCCSVLSAELSQRFGGNAKRTPEEISEKCKA
ncbi:probable glutamate receptor [Denticeps clupeoides]|uniref:Glutamate receptor n=1 Tax=Denticeps clupeoides TaxID=299321 RepID=A0AAY4BKZ6_9TELE|nr:probable glutamate receptor [Denticeps clupeoides]